MSLHRNCPFCNSPQVHMVTFGTGVSLVCADCQMRGPVHENAERATDAWDKRPIEDWWKRLAGWLGSVHGANASDYEAKSVSKDRKNRQIKILSSVSNALLLGKMPEVIFQVTVGEQIIAAGERAHHAAEHLRKTLP